jgi:hypothetical protein
VTSHLKALDPRVEFLYIEAGMESESVRILAGLDTVDNMSDAGMRLENLLVAEMSRFRRHAK